MRLSLGWIAIAVLVGCSDPPAPIIDAASDATRDGPTDAPDDAATDAATDASGDAIDAAVDAPIDAAGDAAVDAPIDASLVDAPDDAPATDAALLDAPDDAFTVDASVLDASPFDASVLDASPFDASVLDASPFDAPDTDASTVDAARQYNCGTFTDAPSWILSPGFHAVVIADATDGLNQPVALTIAGAGFGGRLYVVNQGNDRVLAIDPDTGATSVVVTDTAWPVTPGLLTAIVHDDLGAFDGNLYVGDQGGDSDGDSRIFRVTPAGVATVLAAPPGPGLDDVFGLAFSPGGAYPAGLYATGDTDGALPDWGVFDTAGAGIAFSEVGGAESIAVDRAGTYGGGLWAARPAGGGYPGDDSIGPITPTGLAGPRLATGLAGIHGITFAPPGPFGGRMHAASWATGRLISISPAGVVADLATLLSLTNYDANILAFSPDGSVLYVADRAANRVVCIEPIAAE